MAGKKKQPAAEKHVGTVEHYYPKVKAAAVKLDGDLKVGDTIRIQGHSDDYTEKVKSMQLDHAPVAEGHAGESVGIGVPVKVHENSDVLKVSKPAAAPKKAAKAARKATAARQAPKARKAPKVRKAKATRRAKKARRAKTARKAKTAKRGKTAGARKAAGKSSKTRRRAGRRPARRSR